MTMRNLLFCLTIAILPITAYAQEEQGYISGQVIEGETGESLSGVNVSVEGTQRGAATGTAGRFTIGPLSPGTYTIDARFVGYHPAGRTVNVTAGDTTRLEITLQPQTTQLAGIEVSALRPDLQPEDQLEETDIKEANPRDSGELMRSLAGVAAVRRGPVGLDPVVRGLRETEVGVYLDGTRIFPGGAARMDSPLSHLDPSAIQSIQVVKGPYALTWGAGNLSAVRVNTYNPWEMPPGLLNGRLQSGYDTNFGAFEEALTAYGRSGTIAYQVHGAFRDGDDYRSGASASVPADFRSWEVRGKAGYRTQPGGHLTVSAGYQNQDDIDYPGRLLNADYFHTYNLSTRYELERPTGMLRSFEAMAYVNDVDHGMENEGKPTAEPDPDRMPPFPIQVDITSGVNVTGGRLAAELSPRGVWRAEVGGDVYSAYRSAVRRIWRGDENRMLLFEDFMWPEARITDGGLFVRVERPLGSGFLAAATVRGDAVWAEADTASAFFLENVSQDLSSSELNLSGAATVSASPSDHWSVSVGIGSAVRTADATERYSDRIPASKAQTSAEFVGNPALDPERSTQADLWVEASYPKVVFSFSGFARRIDDYITLEPTDLEKRLPLSPETVYRYVNGEATFWGAESRFAYAVTSALTGEVKADYLWGRDETVEAPALGVAPPRLGLGLRYEPEGEGFFAEGILHAVSDQERVATSRGEQPTEGYVTGDLKGGVELMDRVTLQAGVTNVTGASYVNHLNARNPFTGRQIPEPGRVFFVDLQVTF